MSTIYAPMIVDYNMEDYIVVGISDSIIPDRLDVKVEREDLEKTKIGFTQGSGSGALFIAYKVQDPNRYDNFVQLPIESCKFKRFAEKCVMCNAPKEERP